MQDQIVPLSIIRQMLSQKYAAPAAQSGKINLDGLHEYLSDGIKRSYEGAYTPNEFAGGLAGRGGFEAGPAFGAQNIAGGSSMAQNAPPIDYSSLVQGGGYNNLASAMAGNTQINPADYFAGIAPQAPQQASQQIPQQIQPNQGNPLTGVAPPIKIGPKVGLFGGI